MGPLHHRLLQCVLLVLLSPTAASAQPQTMVAHTASPFGTPLPPNTAEREIHLTDRTKHVNVVHWESVRFVKDGRAFDWQFDSVSTNSFRLAEIAPKEWNVGAIRVYLLHNPYAYPSGR